MTEKKNAINWFEIPATNLDRAMKFYSSILGSELKATEFGKAKMAFFPADQGAITGALVQGESYIPSDKGSLVYLNGGKDLIDILNKVKPAGGKITQEKISIGEYGHIAYFLDTEGNKVALHSMN